MYRKAKLVLAINTLHRLLHSSATENEIDEQVYEMSLNISDPEWMSYLFHSDEFTNPDGSIKADALAEKIISYRAIVL